MSEALETHEMMEKVEHAAHGHPDPSLATRTAILSAILALLAAVAALSSEHTLATAMLHKNQAILYQNQASDQWSFFQAKSIKSQLTGLRIDLAKGDTAELTQKAATYEKEKEQISEHAKELEKNRDEEIELSDHALHKHHWFAYALTFFQASLIFAALSMIVRKSALWWGGAAGGFIGLVFYLKGLI